MTERKTSVPRRTSQAGDEFPPSIAASIERFERLGSRVSLPLFRGDTHEQIERLRKQLELRPALRRSVYDLWYSWAYYQRRRMPKGARPTQRKRKFLQDVAGHSQRLTDLMRDCGGDEFRLVCRLSSDPRRLYFLLTELAYRARETEDRVRPGRGRRRDPYPSNLLRRLFRVFRAVGGNKRSVLVKLPSGECGGDFFQFACGALPLFGVTKTPGAIAKLIERIGLCQSSTGITANQSNSVG